MSGEPLLRRIARRALGEEKAARIWKRLDIVGDIAILRIPLDNSLSIEEAKLLASELLKELRYVKSVWAIASPTEGPYRLRRLVHLAGEKRTITIYREHGCKFKVDVAEVFITPRLNYEHRRIAGLVRPGEVIVNMFAGAGLFSIVAACHARPARVYSIDINPRAYELMVENVRLNRVEGVVEPILGDAASVVAEKLRGVADRVLMPLPELALDYLYYAVEALRDRGYIHVYLHVSEPKGLDPLLLASSIARDRALSHPRVRDVRVEAARRVRSVGPRRVQVVVDLWVERD